MEHKGQSLDQLLGNEPQEVEEAVEATEAPEVAEQPQEAPDGPARGPDGKFLPKQEMGVEESVPPTDKLPKEDYKAIREEREKRQRLESELEALRQQINSQQPKEPTAPPPTIWEDEQGWQQHFGGQLLSQAVQAATTQSRLQMSEMMMAQQHEDFADIKDKLVEFVGSNPTINQQVAESQHPWSTAYQAFKNQQTMQELGATNLDELRAKLREELMAEMQTAQVPVERPGVPPSLTGERNVGTRSGPAWGGPKSLTEYLA